MRTSKSIVFAFGIERKRLLAANDFHLVGCETSNRHAAQTTVASPSAIQSKDKAMFSPFLLKVSFPPAESFFGINVQCESAVRCVFAENLRNLVYSISCVGITSGFLARATSLALLRAFCASLPAFNSAE